MKSVMVDIDTKSSRRMETSCATRLVFLRLILNFNFTLNDVFFNALLSQEIRESQGAGNRMKRGWEILPQYELRRQTSHLERNDKIVAMNAVCNRLVVVCAPFPDQSWRRT